MTKPKEKELQDPLGEYSLEGNPSTNSLIKGPSELRKGTSHPY
jgi:hypothetical protein